MFDALARLCQITDFWRKAIAQKNAAVSRRHESTHLGTSLDTRCLTRCLYCQVTFAPNYILQVLKQ